MLSDPLMPVTQRFPMLRLAGSLGDACPSDERPFALRFAVGGEPATIRHRTSSHQTRAPAQTQRLALCRSFRRTGPDRKSNKR